MDTNITILDSEVIIFFCVFISFIRKYTVFISNRIIKSKNTYFLSYILTNLILTYIKINLNDCIL